MIQRKEESEGKENDECDTPRENHCMDQRANKLIYICTLIIFHSLSPIEIREEENNC